MTQTQLADKAGITSNYLSMLERGVKEHPSDKILSKLMNAMELNGSQRELLLKSVERSRFSLRVPADASREEFEFVLKLQGYLGALSSRQLRTMELAMTGECRN